MNFSIRAEAGPELAKHSRQKRVEPPPLAGPCQDLSPAPSSRERLFREDVLIRGPDASLRGVLSVPPGARGLVLFAQGSGITHMSLRLRGVADRLHEAGLGTLLFDLLSLAESADFDKIFDIALMAGRLRLATEWTLQQALVRGLPIGYFGANTGSAAALWATAELGDRISAVVSRGGRPDLAFARLRAVSAPTLLIVGGHDPDVLALNRRALPLLDRGRLVVIPEATHLFEEPGALEETGHLALEWFERYLVHGHDARFTA